LIARVAQSVERSAVNRKVGGSNPPVSDIFNFYYQLNPSTSTAYLVIEDG
jgi:hypothetical protein